MWGGLVLLAWPSASQACTQRQSDPVITGHQWPRSLDLAFRFADGELVNSSGGHDLLDSPMSLPFYELDRWEFAGDDIDQVSRVAYTVGARGKHARGK